MSKIWDLLTSAGCRKEALVDIVLSIVVPFQRASDAAQRLKKDFMDGCQRCKTDPEAITRDWGTVLGYSFEVANTVMLPFEMAQLGASGAVGVTNLLDDAVRNYGDDAVRQGGSVVAHYGDDVAQYGDNLVGAMCSFSSDTLVATENGKEPIGSLRIGDKVLAYDPETGEISYQEIEAVLVHTDEIIEYLRLDDEVLTTTPEHPFYTAERGWVAAAELRIGEHVRRADGSYGMVRSILLVKKPQRMYNLTVTKAHTYFVGQGQWLVHNDCYDDIIKAADARVTRLGLHGNYQQTLAAAARREPVLPGLYRYQQYPRIPTYQQHHLWPEGLGGPHDGWIVYVKTTPRSVNFHTTNAQGLQKWVDKMLIERTGTGTYTALQTWARNRKNVPELVRYLGEIYHEIGIDFPYLP